MRNIKIKISLLKLHYLSLGNLQNTLLVIYLFLEEAPSLASTSLVTPVQIWLGWVGSNKPCPFQSGYNRFDCTCSKPDMACMGINKKKKSYIFNWPILNFYYVHHSSFCRINCIIVSKIHSSNVMVMLVSGRGVPLLHLYGEVAGCSSLPSLFQALLLLVYQKVVDRAEITVPAL